MDFELMINSFPKLLNAAVVTLKLLSVSLIVGLFIGLLFAILRLNKNIFIINLHMDIHMCLGGLHYWFKYLLYISA